MRAIGVVLLFIFSISASAQIPPLLRDARRSWINIVDWKFQPENSVRGEQLGWQNPGFDDRAWPILKAMSPWEEQGFPDHHGAGWYRYHFFAPASWRGSKVLLQTEGVQEEFDLYVNGKFIRHYGSEDLPLGSDPARAELSEALRYGAANVLALRVTDHGGDGGLVRRVVLRRVPPFSKYKKYLPAPILDSHPELIDLYWHSWEMAWEKISFGTKENGFVPAYMEEGYNEQIYQWDSIFMSFYGRYGNGLFPAMATLDNFYSKQDPDGYIQRIYSKTTGEKILDPGVDYTVTNPPLFAWAEWEYFLLTGDSGRLARVFPVLEKYDAWIEAHTASRIVPGMYWQTGFDSGMDNMPRPNAQMAGWVDATLQQSLTALELTQIANQLGEADKVKFWTAEYERRRKAVNSVAWSAQDGFYYDVDADRKPTGVKHIGAFWSLLSEVASPERAARLIQHLKNPAEFYRLHLFPALSASDPSYTSQASYWAGGVWAPTNFMVIRGLMKYGDEDFAHEASLNHLESMAAVYNSKIDFDHVDPNEIIGPAHTIWECYNPDRLVPCTRADAFHYGRQDFAGWTALGPIALLIEQAVGLQVIGAQNEVIWRLRDSARVGISNLKLGAINLSELVAAPMKNGHREISVTTPHGFELRIFWLGQKIRKRIPAGRTVFSI